MAIFMTGVTGFLGRYIARALLDQGQTIVALSRSRDEETAYARMRYAILATPATKNDTTMNDRDLRRQLHICLGSLDQPGLGLSSQAKDHILQTCDQYIHCGASVSFDQDLSTARRINVDGTRAVMELARQRIKHGSLKRIDHISTAYVAGRRNDVVYEDELVHNQGHKNTYEQSKYEAEIEVRKYMSELPIAVYRPSIIVGDSNSGHTASFKMLYWPIRVYSQGIWRVIPGSPQTPIDLVPVDFVRDAFLAIREQAESLSKTFHIAAGLDGSITLREASELVRSFFPGRKRIIIINPKLGMFILRPLLKAFAFGRLRRVVRLSHVYLPYFIDNPQFDICHMRQILDLKNIPQPQVHTFFKRLLQYCIDTDWGRDLSHYRAQQR